MGSLDTSPANKAHVTMDDVYAAQERTRDYVTASPLIPLNVKIGEGRKVYLKLENLHAVGSFKMRGAANTILSMPKDSVKDGIHTVSTGNFGHAVAWMANELGIPCHVIVPDHVPETKMAGALRYGAKVERVPWPLWWQYIEGSSIPDAPGVLIHPEGHDEILAGTGCIAMEILQQCPDVDAVLIPYGGGGMTAGMGTVLKTLKPSCRVLACEVDTAAPLRQALDTNTPTTVEFHQSFVDGIGSNCVLDHVWDIVRQVVDDSLVVGLEEVKDAIRLLAQRHHVIAEGAGAVTTAAVMTGKLPKYVKNIVCVVSGGNIDYDVLSNILTNDRESKEQ